jgi:hypothetical protein
MGYATIGTLAGFGGGGASGLEGQAIRANQRNQTLIDQGTQLINAIYSGGTVPAYLAAGSGPMSAGTTYYSYKPTQGYSLYTGKDKKTGKGLFTAGPGKTYTGFTPQFFQNYVGAYEQSALPQLGSQYQQARRSIDYGLAQRGLAGSSAAGTAQSQLTRENASQVQNVVDAGINQGEALQGNIAASEQNALNQLYQNANPQQASQAALSSAASFNVPSTFAPIGDAFSNLASQYAINNQLSAYNQPLATDPTLASSLLYGSGLYNPQQGYGSALPNQ